MLRIHVWVLTAPQSLESTSPFPHIRRITDNGFLCGRKDVGRGRNFRPSPVTAQYALTPDLRTAWRSRTRLCWSTTTYRTWRPKTSLRIVGFPSLSRVSAPSTDALDLSRGLPETGIGQSARDLKISTSLLHASASESSPSTQTPLSFSPWSYRESRWINRDENRRKLVLVGARKTSPGT